MKALAAGFLVSLTACAGAPVSQEVLKIVPLVKAEKYDEAAANPDLLAPAFVEALREMKAEGADPKRIVRVADLFFDNYPFSVKDMTIDEAVFETVAEIHYESNLKLTSPIHSCWQVDACETLDDLIELLDGWNDEHLDGGRCARKVLDIARNAQRSGLSVTFKTVRLRDPRQGNNPLSDLFRKCSQPFSTSPWLPVIAFRVTSLDGWMYQKRRHEAWRDRWEMNSYSRWKRMFLARLAWLGALRQEPKMERGSGSYMASKYDARLGRLGRALDAFSSLFDGANSKSPGPETFIPVAKELIQAGQGTPFADMAQQCGVIYFQDSKREADAEAWLRSQLKEFDETFRVAYSLLYMSDPISSDRTSEQSIDLAREAYEVDREGTSAISALARWGNLLHSEGRSAEAVERLDAALARGPAPLGTFEDESADFARSSAGRLLGEILLEQTKWQRAYEVIRDWELYTTCGTTQGDSEWRNDSMALCLEKLGRPREALEFHWKAACSSYDMKQDRAEKVKGSYASQGQLAELRELVRKKVEGIESWGKKVGNEDALKWLADELGVAVK